MLRKQSFILLISSALLTTVFAAPPRVEHSKVYKTINGEPSLSTKYAVACGQRSGLGCRSGVFQMNGVPQTKFQVNVLEKRRGFINEKYIEGPTSVSLEKGKSVNIRAACHGNCDGEMRGTIDHIPVS